LKPPDAGPALREVEVESTIPPPSRPAALSWGRAGGSGGGPSWGRAGSSAGATWGRPAAVTNVEGESREAAETPNGLRQVSGNIDLLPHEQLARDSIMQRQQEAQKRQVNIPSGPGPIATRAGRHIPNRRLPSNEDERLAFARAAAERRKALNGGGPLVRQTMSSAHRLGDIERDSIPSQDSEELNKANVWKQLKRKGTRGATSPFPEKLATKPRIDTTIPEKLSREPGVDAFVEGRPKREEEAKFQRYTPLRDDSSSTFSGAATNKRSQEHSVREEQSWSDNYDGRDENGSIGDTAPTTRNREALYSRREEWSRPNSNYRRNDSRPMFSNTVPAGLYPRREPRTSQDNNGRRDDYFPQGNFSQAPVPQTDESVEGARSFTISRTLGDNPHPERSERVEEQRQSSGQTRRSTIYEEPGPSRQAPARFTADRGKSKDKSRRRQQFIEDEDEEESNQRAELRRERKRKKAAKRAATPTPILLPEFISVANLAMALRIKANDFVEKMEELGYEETAMDHILNSEDSALIAMEHNFEAIIDRSESEDLKAREPAADPTTLPPRPPVVTIMGHVDHGKTTLLDWLRKSSVAATEHGGITQHIGAFSVPMPSGKIITFLDTPGHAAFLSMRQRGANVTDIVILVVAADDSVKPQTTEAINHAKAAKVPIIVAINKIDKEEANIDRVKQDLARHGVDVEDFGGDTQVVCVSGKTGQGMGELEEAAVALSELLDMRSEVDGQAEGWVLEASIKSMGKVATVLVRRGTMRVGDFIVAGNTWARIRCLRNEAGVEIESAGPGTPVEVDGWREQPLAGDEVLQAPDESKAKSVVEYRVEKVERDKMAQDMEAINEFRKSEQEKRDVEKEEERLAKEAKAAQETFTPGAKAEKDSGPKEIYFIVKGDVSGSVEAVLDSINMLGNKEVTPHVLRSGVGQLSEFDIEHAAAAKGYLVNFNTAVDPHISQLAEQAKVSIIDGNVIYRLVDDIKAELSKHLPPLKTQRVLGEAEIAQIFEITVKGRQVKSIAGSKVRNGSILRNAKFRVLRNNEKVFDGMFLPFPIPTISSGLVYS